MAFIWKYECNFEKYIFLAIVTKVIKSLKHFFELVIMYYIMY